jgi:DNA-binding CsgD family transcriptional regulator
MARTSASPGELQLLNSLVSQLAADAPLLIVVDDCQLADRPSLQWLSVLPGRIEHSRVCVLASIGSGERSGAADLLEEFRGASSTELRLGPLGDDAVAAVLTEALGERPGASLLHEAIRSTGGNPLLLMQVIALIEEQGALSLDCSDELLETPMPLLAARLHTKIRRVSADALAVCDVVAILGAAATIDRVSEMSGVDAVTVAGIAESLTGMAILSVSGGTVQFAQPLVRSALMGNLTYSYLRDLHGQAATALAESGAPPPAVAEHVLASGILAAPWVLPVLRAAAVEARTAGDLRSAAAYLRRAQLEPGDDETPAILIDLGVTEAGFDVSAAVGHLREAVRTATEPGQKSAARERLWSVLALAGSQAGEGDHEAGKASAGEPREPAAKFRIRSVELGLHDPDTVAEALASIDTICIADAGPDAESEPPSARALSLLAQKHAWAGHSREKAVALANRALATPLTRPDSLQAFLRAAQVIAAAGDPQRAKQICDLAVAATNRWQHNLAQAVARSARSAASRQLGNLQQAWEDAQLSLKFLSKSGADLRGGAAIQIIAAAVDVQVDTGELEQASALLDTAGLSGRINRSINAAALLMARARLRLAQNRTAEAAHDFQICGDLLTAWGIDNPAGYPWRSGLALAEAGHTAHGPVLELAETEVRLARTWASPGPLGHALRALGTVSEGNAGRAALRESIAVLTDTPWQLELARSLFAYGQALTQNAEPAPARRDLRAAIEAAEHCDAHRLAQQARTAHAAAGGRLRRSAETGPPALTDAERRVAELAAKNMTNSDIATMLYISRRTVEIHLSRTYRKLRIDGRNGLPTALHAPQD